jgi:hypothetical protein
LFFFGEKGVYKKKEGMNKFAEALEKNDVKTIQDMILKNELIITNDVIKQVIDSKNLYLLNLLLNTKKNNQVDFSERLKDNGRKILTYAINNSSNLIIYQIINHSEGCLNDPDFLRQSIQEKNNTITRLLIKRGALVDKFLIYLALTSEINNDIIEMMLDNLFLNKILTNDDKNILLSLFFNGINYSNSDIIYKILSYDKTLVNKTDLFERWTPFLYACSFHNYEVVRVLLGFGGDVNSNNDKGLNTLMLASNKVKSDDENINQNNIQIIKLLLNSSKVNVNKQNEKDGWTALMYAVKNSNIEIIKCLLQIGKADINVLNKKGQSVFNLVEDNKEIKDILSGKMVSPLLQNSGGSKQQRGFSEEWLQQVLSEDGYEVDEIKEFYRKLTLELDVHDFEDILNLTDDDWSNAGFAQLVKDLIKTYVSTLIPNKKQKTSESSTVNGLQIGSVNLKKISGPTSITILAPQNNQIGVDGKVKNITDYEHQKIVYGSLPAIILFGDTHWSNQGMCKNCDDDEECCTIFSDYFLKTLDSLYVTSKTPIDFYVETEQIKNEERSGLLSSLALNKDEKKLNANLKSYPLNNIIKNRTCFIKELRETAIYEKKCPTKKVRWHYIDARYSNSYEGIMYVLIVLLVFEKDNNHILSDILYIFDFISPDELILYVHIFSECIKNPELFFKNMYDVTRFPIIKQTSLIYKQISKMKPPLNNFEMWYGWICKYYTNTLYNLIEHDYFYFIRNTEYENPVMKEFFRRMKIDTFNYPNSKINFTNFGKWISNEIEFYLIPALRDTKNNSLQFEKTFFNFVFTNIIDKNQGFINLGFDTFFVDLYFITRLFKMPENGEPSVLTIGYFGEFHCDNIQHFLTWISESYRVLEHFHPEDRKNSLRCLEMPSFDFNSRVFNFKLLENQILSSTPLKSLNTVWSQYQIRKKEKQIKEKEKHKEIKKLIGLYLK